MLFGAYFYVYRDLTRPELTGFGRNRKGSRCSGTGKEEDGTSLQAK
jgi:hypothetical protein